MKHPALLLALNIASISVFADPLGARGIVYGVLFAVCSAVFYVQREKPPLLGANLKERPVWVKDSFKAPPNIVSAYILASIGVGIWVLVFVLELIWPGCKPACA